MRRNAFNLSLVGLTLLLSTALACIERTVTINTVPDGATVMLNDQEVGASPVTVPFTWYGNYDVVCRKPGYKTLKTNVKLTTPWYQLPVVDLFTECMVPFTVRDRRAFDLQLEQERPPTKAELLNRAAEAKAQSLTEGP